MQDIKMLLKTLTKEISKHLQQVKMSGNGFLEIGLFVYFNNVNKSHWFISLNWNYNLNKKTRILLIWKHSSYIASVNSLKTHTNKKYTCLACLPVASVTQDCKRFVTLKSSKAPSGLLWNYGTFRFTSWINSNCKKLGNSISHM